MSWSEILNTNPVRLKQQVDKAYEEYKKETKEANKNESIR